MKCVRIQHNKDWWAVQQEIGVLRRLQSKSIPMITDVLYDEKQVCLVMEYMQGISLEEKIKRDGIMKEAEAVDCGIQIAELLCELHNLPGKLVHGDLKPANLIWNQGRIALLDFGASIFQYKGREERWGKEGTYYSPGYGAPELLNSSPITIESDVYALGAVLFYLITGKVPVDGKEFPSVREEIPECSMKMEKFILQCTKRLPEERYHSMEEIRTRLAILEKRRKQIKKADIFSRISGLYRKRKQFKTLQNILLTDGKKESFVLNCLEREE